LSLITEITRGLDALSALMEKELEEWTKLMGNGRSGVSFFYKGYINIQPLHPKMYATNYYNVLDQLEEERTS